MQTVIITVKGIYCCYYYYNYSLVVVLVVAVVVVVVVVVVVKATIERSQNVPILNRNFH